MMVYLERISPDRNVRRFYRATVRPTLFGEWALIREWGRIGSPRGQRAERWFSGRAMASAALAQLVAAKRRKGYAG
jgi:predicted DNA-binding WGR domain protein